MKAYYIVRSYFADRDGVSAFARFMERDLAVDCFYSLPCTSKSYGHSISKVREDGMEMLLAERDGQYDYWLSDEESAADARPTEDRWAKAE